MMPRRIGKSDTVSSLFGDAEVRAAGRMVAAGKAWLIPDDQIPEYAPRTNDVGKVAAFAIVLRTKHVVEFDAHVSAILGEAT